MSEEPEELRCADDEANGSDRLAPLVFRILGVDRYTLHGLFMPLYSISILYCRPLNEARHLAVIDMKWEILWRNLFSDPDIRQTLLIYCVYFMVRNN
uniref:Rab-GAP TBC domain-containing protein n=1 Tax=Angiostrongylus cantonensis TaxID=6313 RepID=A0A0K0DCC5_ANGCA